MAGKAPRDRQSPALVHPLIRSEWQMEVAAAVQVLAGIPQEVDLPGLRAYAVGLLDSIAAPRNHGERMIALALLASLALRRLGLDERVLISAFFGEPGTRLTTLPLGKSIAPRERTLAERAREIVDRDYAAALTVQTLSARLHAHRNVLTKQFKAAFGHSIPEYIRMRRRMAALTLLWNNSFSNEDIAQSIGCSSRTFYRHYGARTATLLLRSTRATLQSGTTKCK